MYKIGNIYLITAIAVIGGMLFGFDIASMSAILAEDPYKCYFNEGGLNADGSCKGPESSTQGGISAAMPGGSYLGALISGILTDRFGRKSAIQLSIVAWIIGSILATAAQNVAMLVVGRVILGMCIGVASAQVPVYVSELAPPTKRGRLVGTQQWAITWGIMIMFYVSYGTSFIKGDAAWRIPWGLQMIPGLLLALGLAFTPESPRWLARKNRWDEAKAVLVLVHGKGNPNDPIVESEMQDIREMVEFERANADVTYFDLLKPNMINRTHIGVATQMWSQLTGMNVMMYYITFVFQMTGKTGNANLLSSSIQYVINVVMTLPALIWIDKWGRRGPLVIGAIFMGIFMFANAGILKGAGSPAPPGGVGGVREVSWQVHGPAGNGLIACTYLFVASYAPTWGPVSWIYPPELYPLRVRGKAVALATSANWAFNFALSYFVPPAFENIKWKVYCLFGAFNIAMAIHAFFLFPETAGKTLEEVAGMFEDPKGIKYIGTPPWRTKVVTHRRERFEETAERTGSVAVARDEVSKDADSSDESPERKYVEHAHVEVPNKVA